MRSVPTRPSYIASEISDRRRRALGGSRTNGTVSPSMSNVSATAQHLPSGQGKSGMALAFPEKVNRIDQFRPSCQDQYPAERAAPFI